MGQAFVEFAIVLPILVLLVLASRSSASLFHNYLAITDAARVGARAAAVKRTQAPVPPRNRDPEHGLGKAVEHDFQPDHLRHAGAERRRSRQSTVKYPYASASRASAPRET